ncbi:MAG TPA: DUF6152 family protein [Vicinamibacterales bacterium]|nr:DUF6152 family protein [Vicinamibacterales bacterium]
MTTLATDSTGGRATLTGGQKTDQRPTCHPGSHLNGSGSTRTWVYLEAADGTVWALEGASVVQLQRRGWTKEKLKAGDGVETIFD